MDEFIDYLRQTLKSLHSKLKEAVDVVERDEILQEIDSFQRELRELTQGEMYD